MVNVNRGLNLHKASYDEQINIIFLNIVLTNFMNFNIIKSLKIDNSRKLASIN